MEKDLVDDSADSMDFVAVGLLSTWEKYKLISQFYSFYDVDSVKAKGFRQLLDFPPDFHFDLIIHDSSGTRPLLALADRFHKAQLIAVSAYPGIEETNHMTKSPNFPSFTANIYKDDVEDNFYDRMESFLVYIINELMLDYHWFPKAEKILETVYPMNRSLTEIYKSTKLVLVNDNPAMGDGMPILPGVIPVGGLQIEEPKPLPKDLEEIFSIPSKGVVLFSLGTNMKSEMLGEHRIKEVLSALEEFSDYTFIWKIDMTNFHLKIPKNVHIKTWLPQNDILAHNRTRLFISHAGGLSTQESTWHGVPMLALPVVVDQFPVSFSIINL